ncbi:MAG: sulfotransferase family protein [Rhodobacter sp.]|nr:sulfotransferase family protein [Rhodobacter sp.]
MKADLRVIGTGFGRTGTDSMREALNILGVGPCHHMRELVANPDHKQVWRDFNVSGDADWDKLLGGYGSCVDWPSAHYWPRLMSDFPNARMLLTWRSAESWWTSFEKTILRVLQADTETEETVPGSQLISLRVFGGKPMTREHCIATYEANVARVRREVPPERLLVYKIGDGWAPLCAFLGLDIPDMPFPRSNDTAAFQKRFTDKLNS